MTQAFGDDQFERELRAVLHDRAEEIASRAHTSGEMTALLTPRLLPGSRARRSRDRTVSSGAPTMSAVSEIE